MSQTIETLFADLCALHSLTAITVGYSNNGLAPEYRWTSYVHWESQVMCASGGGATAHEALANALKEAAAKRNGNIHVPSEIVMGEAA